MSNWIGEDNYPTEECLEHLKTCPASEAFEILRENWWPFDGTGVGYPTDPERFVAQGGVIRFATGGWSGNEDMIDAAMMNVMVRLCWRLSARGGLYVFELPDD